MRVCVTDNMTRRNNWFERIASNRFKSMSRRTTPKIRAVTTMCRERGLPCDLFKNVLGFIFMDRDQHRAYFTRLVIHEQFSNVDFSRRQDEEVFKELPEHWAFSLSIDDPYDVIQLQSINCRICGCYKAPPPDVPRHIICFGH